MHILILVSALSDMQKLSEVLWLITDFLYRQNWIIKVHFSPKLRDKFDLLINLDWCPHLGCY